MTTISVDAMKAKFPEFAGLPPAQIGFAIEEAALLISDGSTWVSQANAQLAMMYYAGHVLAVALMTAESGTGQIVQSESISGLGSTTFAVVKQPPEACDLDKTIYGARYLDLVQRNFSGGFPI